MPARSSHFFAQEFNALDLEEINNASTNGRVLVDTTLGVLAVKNGTEKIGNISCLFDEFITSKYVYVYRSKGYGTIHLLHLGL